MLKTANKGQWVINHRQLSLQDGTKVVELDPKQYALLVLLLKFKHQDVSKSQILSEVWGQRVVSEDAIYVAINGLRRLLGDDAKSPKYIKTISGVGYRWVGPPLCDALPSSLDSFLLKAALCLVAISFVVFWQMPRAPVKQVIPDHLAEPFNHARFIINNHPEQLDRAISLLKSISIEAPQLSEPIYWLAKAHFSQLDPKSDNYSEGKLHIKTILERVLSDYPEHKEANLLYAKLIFMGNMNTKDAEVYFLNALPNSEAHHMYGQYLLALGRNDEAMHHIRTYQTMEPDGYSSESVAWVYMMSQQFDEAFEVLDRLRPYAQSNRFYHVCLRAIYEQLGRFDLALQELIWVMKYEGYTESEITMIEKQFATQGMEGVYRWLLYQDTRRADIGHYDAPMSQARYATAIGDKQLALHYLEQSRLAGQYAFLWIAADPHFLSLRQDEKFTQLVQNHILKADISDI
ncbi:winged helix-turn-helix domain-containing protein [Pseudoalteromonas luteoviolacea]|uniref:winged helix-turn-helix domain-containing protein n=1 Tax=Pseudoalteromonas luteoviolacea TaxID=43657 RepID=UPI001EEEC91A|nr:winged helix-turn-helix domain-containing protein [Pseudoalteromonas luteoviolacea]MCF6441397.1 winged helix-turn-helix domain-containing protein [Pseudoalteromonas luteoviolacea]